MFPLVSETRVARVPSSLVGFRLDKAALELVGDGFSRSRLQHWIEEGFLQVNDVIATLPSVKVEEGQKLLLRIPETEVPSVESGLIPTILYQDSGLLVLFKPSGIPMHGTSIGDIRPSVASWLVHVFGSNLPVCQGVERPGIVHRLDRDTSGVCVVALQEDVFVDLMRQFSGRTVKKEYLALVYGCPRFHSDWIDKCLVSDSQRPDKVKVANSVQTGAREALTYWEVVENFSIGACLRVSPETGRKHQIRVHLASVNLPIIGDPIYRACNFGKGVLADGHPPLQRTLLHAYSLAFENPQTGKLMSFSADPPEDFQEMRAFLSS